MYSFNKAMIAAALAVAISAATFAAGSWAQEKGSGSGSMSQKMGKGSGSGSGSGNHTAIKGDAGPASQAFNDANMKMHTDMSITFSGDADVDFVRGMIPHHQGAIDMAKVVLQYGKDPQLRKLAEDIVKAQESEIGQMREWLKKNGK